MDNIFFLLKDKRQNELKLLEENCDNKEHERILNIFSLCIPI